MQEIFKEKSKKVGKNTMGPTELGIHTLKKC